MRKQSPSLVYRNTPGYENRAMGLRVNALGFRGEAFDRQRRSEDPPRIICLGDSCTFGWFVDDAHTYPVLLQKRLAEGGFKAQVINAGVPGYSSWQARVWCEEELFSLRPDVLVLYVGWNDLFEADPVADSQKSPRAKKWAFLMRKSQFLTLLRHSLTRLKDMRAGPSAPGDRRYTNFDPRFYRYQMEWILQASETRGIRVMLLTLPTSHPPSSDVIASGGAEAKRHMLYRTYNQSIHRLGERRGTVLVDLAKRMNGRLDLFSDFCHPSPAGNEVIAGAIADAMTRDSAIASVLRQR